MGLKCAFIRVNVAYEGLIYGAVDGPAFHQQYSLTVACVCVGEDDESL